jgi:hypothetical protein
MEGMLTYPRNFKRSFLLRPANGASFFPAIGYCDEEEHIQVGGFAEYTKFVDRTAGDLLAGAKQGIYASVFDDSMLHLDNAVDYSEQL